MRVDSLARRRAMAALVLTASVTVATVVAVPAGAHAAGTPGVLSIRSNAMWFTAGAGTANRVVITATERLMRIVESAAPIILDASALAAGCVSRTPHEVLCSTVGRVVVQAGDGNDTVRVSGGRPAVVYGGDGDDTLNVIGSGADTGTGPGVGGASRVHGEAGNDVLFGTMLGDHLDGGAGRDDIYGLDGFDVLIGGDGPDVLDGGPGQDSVAGLDGDDELTGGQDTDLLHGGRGADVLNGGDGADNLFGDDGDDELKAGPGHDQSHDGGDGVDDCSGAARVRVSCES